MGIGPEREPARSGRRGGADQSHLQWSFRYELLCRFRCRMAPPVIGQCRDTTIASYEYGPFGELIRATGPMAKVNPFRFSTKFDDDESDFLYYGHRYYIPGIGRWLSRDPSGETDSFSLYCVLKNDAVNHADNLGLWATDVHHQLVEDWLASSGVPGAPNYHHFLWTSCCYLDVIACIQEGSDEVDGVGTFGNNLWWCEAQSSFYSYQHADEGRGRRPTRRASGIPILRVLGPKYFFGQTLGRHSQTASLL